MHRHTLKLRHSAFTLIELLVVIAIIAILAAILFPVFAQARAAARKANGISMTKQVALAILMYNQDFDEAYPLAGWTCGTYSGVPNVCGLTQWPNVVSPYHKNAQIVQDPADASQSGSYYSNGLHTLIYNDLLAHNPAPVPGDPYGQVDWCGNQNTPGCLAEASEVGRSAASVVAPSDCVLITEGNCPWGAAGSQSAAAAGQCAANLAGTQGVPLPSPDFTGTTNPCSKFAHEQDMSEYQAVLITGTNYSGWNAYQGLPIHTSHTFTVYAYVDGHAKAVRAFDPNNQTAPYYGNLLHGTLPFRKNYDPGQNAYPAAPNTLGLGSGPPYDNWQ
jgi:prepilin-type N-terminal cleavage/methylation domain-containing protein